jgi:hypothetical protein
MLFSALTEIKEGFYLSELTHKKEDPWMDARKGLARKSDREITKASMGDYYSTLG